MDVQTPYALDLSSLLFTAFTLGFTPLLLIGLLFRMAVHPITLLYEWLTEEPKAPPLLTPWSPQYPVPTTPRAASSPRSPYAAPSPLPRGSEGFSSPFRRYSPTLRAQSLRSSSGGGTYSGPAYTGHAMSARSAMPVMSTTATRGTGTYLNISYSPGMGASVSVGSGQPSVFGVGLADKSSKYQPTLRHLPPRQVQPYRPETISSIAGAQAHASAQPLALDRSFRQIEEDKWDRTERWRREIMEDDF